MTPEALLEFLRSRTTVRAYEDRPVPREVLERLLEAAIRAPSGTNRQPWRFSVVTSREMRQKLADATQGAIDKIRGLLASAGRSDHLGDYWDYFVRPLRSAPAFVVVQYRRHNDLMAGMIQGAGGDPKAFSTPDQWSVELSAASAAAMQLLLQAHAEGLGACWLAGCLLARDELARLLRIQPPWKILTGVTVGWPAERPTPTARKSLEKVVEWFEDAAAGGGTGSEKR
jgi:nitroreductase